jgi:hypothetical protein
MSSFKERLLAVSLFIGAATLIAPPLFEHLVDRVIGSSAAQGIPPNIEVSSSPVCMDSHGDSGSGYGISIWRLAPSTVAALKQDSDSLLKSARHARGRAGISSPRCPDHPYERWVDGPPMPIRDALLTGDCKMADQQSGGQILRTLQNARVFSTTETCENARSILLIYPDEGLLVSLGEKPINVHMGH